MALTHGFKVKHMGAVRTSDCFFKKILNPQNRENTVKNRENP